MANLLPGDVKKEIRKEYLLRLVTTLSAHAVFGTLVVISFALSGFFDVRTNYLLVKAQRDSVKAVELSDEEKAMKQAFDDFRVQIDALTVPKATPVPATDIIRVVMVGMGSEVTLKSFVFSGDPAGKRKLVISGVSKTRDALVAFQKHLTDNDMFSAVELPVSNFSKRTDIDFTVTLSITEI